MKQVATREAVFKVADEIAADGRVPSQVEVQERTGGSYTTVQKHLEAWRQEKASAAQIDVPAPVKAVGDRALRDIYSAAVEAAKNALMPVVEQAQAAATEAQEGRVAAEREIARLEAALEGKDAELITMRERVRTAETATATMDGRLQATTEQLTNVSERLHGAEQDLAKGAALLLALEASQELSAAIAQIRARMSDDTFQSAAAPKGSGAATKGGK